MPGSCHLARRQIRTGPAIRAESARKAILKLRAHANRMHKVGTSAKSLYAKGTALVFLV